MPPACLNKRVDSVISILGLGSIADRRTAGFSQGERMKTALGRAILHSPQNLLLDEPTNGLDVPTIRSLRDLLRRLRDSGVCVIFSSHVLDEVRALCDKVVIISNGSLVATEVHLFREPTASAYDLFKWTSALPMCCSFSNSKSFHFSSSLPCTSNRL